MSSVREGAEGQRSDGRRCEACAACRRGRDGREGARIQAARPQKPGSPLHDVSPLPAKEDWTQPGETSEGVEPDGGRSAHGRGSALRPPAQPDCGQTQPEINTPL